MGVKAKQRIGILTLFCSLIMFVNLLLLAVHLLADFDICGGFHIPTLSSFIYFIIILFIILTPSFIDHMILLLPLMQTYRGIPCPNTGMFPFCFLIWEKVIRHGIDLHLDVIADKVLGYHG